MDRLGSAHEEQDRAAAVPRSAICGSERSVYVQWFCTSSTPCAVVSKYFRDLSSFLDQAQAHEAFQFFLHPESPFISPFTTVRNGVLNLLMTHGDN